MQLVSLAESVRLLFATCLDTFAFVFLKRKHHASPTQPAKLRAGKPVDHFFSSGSRPESRAEQIATIVIDVGTARANFA
jgi:hypothetical protein